MKKKILCGSIYFLGILLLGTTQLNAQVFTKITEGPLVNKQGNSTVSSWGDYDGDGDLDLFQTISNVSAEHPNKYSLLYQNNCNGEFTLVKKIPTDLLSTSNHNPSSVWIDYDNDGDLDIYIGVGGNSQEYLYENQGDGTFVSVSKTITNLPNYTLAETGGNFIDVGKGGSVWLDYDNDGLLDFYTGRRELYHNNGAGDFDVLTVSPFNDITEFLRGDNLSTADFNNDGLMDIYVCSPLSNLAFGPEMQLFQNMGNGTFASNDNTGLTNFTGLTYGSCWGDIDNDGDLDVYVAGGNYFNGAWDKLMKNNGDGTFTETFMSSQVSIGQGGGAFADYDNDGDLDLYLTGRLNRLFENDGTGTFTEITTEIVSNDIVASCFGTCWADTDNDGDLDLFVPAAGGAPNDRFYINNTTGKNWLKVHCKGVQSNANAIGARVYVKATINGQSVWQMREITMNGSRGGESGGASGHVVHIGLGDATMIETLKIVWPASGTTQEFQNVTPNRFLEIVENVNTISEMQACIPDLPIENPGYATGKLFIDNNSNCTFEAGVDYQISNRAIKASPGNYFAFTDNNGDYLFELPEGQYEISLVQTDQVLDPNLTCSANPVKTASVTEGGTDHVESMIIITPQPQDDCGGKLDIDISSMVNGVLNSTPCPGQSSEYCFTFTNNSTSPMSCGSNIIITFPTGFNIIGDDLGTSPINEYSIEISDNNGNTLTPTAIEFVDSDLTDYNLGNQVTFTFNEDCDDGNSIIPINGQILICMEVIVDNSAVGPFNVDAEYNDGQLTPELIDGDNFQGGSSAFGTFTTDYDVTTIGATGVTVPGKIWIGTNAEMEDLATNHLGSTSNIIPGSPTLDLATNQMLIVDGSTDPAVLNFWCQEVDLEVGKEYQFRYWVNNNMDPNQPTGEDPIIDILINGDPVVVAGNQSPATIEPANDPPFDGWVRKSIFICPDVTGPVSICLSLQAAIDPSSDLGRNFSVDNIRIDEFYEGSETQEACLPFDPNDKTVTPQGCSENGNIEKNQELTYKIRFQNVGEGPAHNVLLRDQLDEDLDLSTLQIVASSHTITNVQIIPDNTLIVKFDNIHLPAEVFDAAGSHGYLIFKIKPKTGLPDGTTIENQTGIYFDRNEVVLTNVTKNTLYDKPTPEAAFTYKHSCSQTGFVYDFSYTGGTPDNATYFWEFEGATVTTSTVQNPTGIVFTNGSGLKKVTLTVSRNGCSDMVYENISVVNGLSANGKKVIICHNGQSIEVSSSSLASHLAHGDCVGACAGSGNKSLKHSQVVKAEAGFSVHLMPNPSSDVCQIEVQGLKPQEKVVIEVFSFTGQVVERIETEEHSVNMATRSLTNGLYVVKITSSGQTSSHKLLIQH